MALNLAETGRTKNSFLRVTLSLTRPHGEMLDELAEFNQNDKSKLVRLLVAMEYASFCEENNRTEKNPHYILACKDLTVAGLR